MNIKILTGRYDAHSDYCVHAAWLVQLYSTITQRNVVSTLLADIGL